MMTWVNTWVKAQKANDGHQLDMYSYLTLPTDAWWRHGMEAFFASLALCEWNPPDSHQTGSITQSFHIFLYMHEQTVEQAMLLSVIWYAMLCMGRNVMTQRDNFFEMGLQRHFDMIKICVTQSTNLEVQWNHPNPVKQFHLTLHQVDPHSSIIIGWPILIDECHIRITKYTECPWRQYNGKFINRYIH